MAEDQILPVLSVLTLYLAQSLQQVVDLVQVVMLAEQMEVLAVLAEAQSKVAQEAQAILHLYRQAKEIVVVMAAQPQAAEHRGQKLKRHLLTEPPTLVAAGAGAVVVELGAARALQAAQALLS